MYPLIKIVNRNCPKWQQQGGLITGQTAGEVAEMEDASTEFTEKHQPEETE